MVVEERLRAPAPSHQSVQAEGPVGLTEALTTVRRRFCLPSTLAHRGGLEAALGANLLGAMVDGLRP